MTNKSREADTIKTSMFSEAAMMIARVWKQQIFPLPFERVYYLDGIRVVVSVSEYKEETKDKKHE